MQQFICKLRRDFAEKVMQQQDTKFGLYQVVDKCPWWRKSLLEFLSCVSLVFENIDTKAKRRLAQSHVR